MSRLRTFSFPKLGDAFSSKQKRSDDNMNNSFTSSDASMDSSNSIATSTHSRRSSAASTTSSPATPSSSNRSHNRWPSSTSSLVTLPDSPINVTKSALHDLVEDPAERDDGLYDLPMRPVEEPFCICDTPYCEHRESRVQSVLYHSTASDWSPTDEFGSDEDFTTDPFTKHRRSGEFSADTFTSRLSRRFPSLSRRWKEPQSPRTRATATVHSAPPSRSSSLRLRSRGQSLATHAEADDPIAASLTSIECHSEENVMTRSRASTHSRPVPLDISVTQPMQDPIDRQELASTPLLPPVMAEHLSNSTEALQSPLQSPSVAEPGVIASMGATPICTPDMTALPSPPLSSKPSLASFHVARNTLHPTSEIPPMTISEETLHDLDNDIWAAKLGHANFHITPEPYMPEECTLQSCKRLLEDWEHARSQFMRQAALVRENYGPTSPIFRFTEQKWAGIDNLWRTFQEHANAEATRNQPPSSTDGRDGNGSPVSSPVLLTTLAETQPIAKMSTLNDTLSSTKFPLIEEKDVVGPMVRYAQVSQWQHQQSQIRSRVGRRPGGFLRIFTDPGALLGIRR